MIRLQDLFGGDPSSKPTVSLPERTLSVGAMCVQPPCCSGGPEAPLVLHRSQLGGAAWDHLPIEDAAQSSAKVETYKLAPWTLIDHLGLDYGASGYIDSIAAISFRRSSGANVRPATSMSALPGQVYKGMERFSIPLFLRQ